MKTWLKYGLIGLGIGLILGILLFPTIRSIITDEVLVQSLNPCNRPIDNSFMGSCGFNHDIAIMKAFFITALILSLVGFIIGAYAGFIINNHRTKSSLGAFAKK